MTSLGERQRFRIFWESRIIMALKHIMSLLLLSGVDPHPLQVLVDLVPQLAAH
jgi:hypothetical protein